MAKESLTFEKIETIQYEQEFNVLSGGAIIGTVHFHRGRWHGVTNFDAKASSMCLTRQQAAGKVARRFRKGYSPMEGA